MIIHYTQLQVETIVKKKFELLQVRFYENHMVLNLEKCHYPNNI